MPIRKKGQLNRRRFLQKSMQIAAGSLALPYLVPARAVGSGETAAAGNRITIGFIGIGWQGTENLRGFLVQPDAQVLAVCDVDTNHLNEARNIVNNHYGNQDCVVYKDFRELLNRRDIDAVCISLPDHWHAIAAITAARLGKDIYGEKPLAHDISEGRAICEAVKRYGIVWQTGSWQRSFANFRFGCELVLNGRIGKVHTVEVGLPQGNVELRRVAGLPADKTIEQLSQPVPVPDSLDYDRWLGPAPYAPYCPARVHVHWRWHFDYGGGQLTDWVGHHVDIANWGLGTEYTGPVEVEGTGQYPQTSLWNTPETYRVTAKYANGITMIVAGGDKNIRSGTKWLGDKGWVWVDRGDKIEAEPAGLLNEKIGPCDIHLYRSPGHVRNFLDCVKTRAATIAPCEPAHRAASVGHLGNIAMRLGRKISFDPGTEQIINDPDASRLLGRAMRSPWHL